MQIICPHCMTSYAINLSSLGATGRTVRCSRCKETWLARPEDAVEEIVVPAMAETGHSTGQSDAADDWNSYASNEASERAPVVDSPSLASDWPADGETETENDRESTARLDEEQSDLPSVGHQSWFRNLFRRRARPVSPVRRKSHFGLLPTACAGMGALVAALVIWRMDMVRLLPQTAAFYRMVGLEVNLRGLVFKDVKVSNESVDGKSLLVIEGVIVGEARKPVEIPRLRFSVRDAQGVEIYAWNTVLEQTVLRPGERAFFKSRLASPPPEGRNIDIRFFNRRDIAGGSA